MKEELLRILKSYKQDSILDHFGILSKDEKEYILNTCSGIDFSLLDFVFYRLLNTNDGFNHNYKIFQTNNKLTNINEFKNDYFSKIYNEGLYRIAKKEVALCIISSNDNLDFSPFSLNQIETGISLLEVYIRKLKRLSNLAKTNFSSLVNDDSDLIPIYFMTNNKHFDEIYEFLEKRNFFNYDPIIAFQQDDFMLLDKNGKLILKDKTEISRKSNGSGGVLLALNKYGIFNHMNELNIKYVHTVDLEDLNVKMCDPFKIGLLIENNYDILTHCVKYNQKFKHLNSNKINKYENNCYSFVNNKDAKDYLWPINTVCTLDFLANSCQKKFNLASDIHFKKVKTSTYYPKYKIFKEIDCYKLYFSLLDILNFTNNIGLIEYDLEETEFIDYSNLNLSIKNLKNKLENKCILNR